MWHLQLGRSDYPRTPQDTPGHPSGHPRTYLFPNIYIQDTLIKVIYLHSGSATAIFTVIVFTKWILPLKKIIPMVDIGFDEISLSSPTYLKALTISK